MLERQSVQLKLLVFNALRKIQLSVIDSYYLLDKEVYGCAKDIVEGEKMNVRLLSRLRAARKAAWQRGTPSTPHRHDGPEGGLAGL